MTDEVEVPTQVAAEQGQEETPVVEEPILEPAIEESIVELPKKKTAQERIDEITRSRREAEREAEYWRKIALQKEQIPEPEKTPADMPGRPSRPTLDQFETTVDYEDALFEWRDKVRDQETAVKQARSDEEKALRTFNEKAKKVREEYQDFDEVIEAPVFSAVMRAVLLRSENGPDVAYFLGKPENRDLSDRIRNMPLESQAYEIGKLESSLLLAKKTRKVPGAPPPITPVGMGGTGGKEKDPSEMTTEEWFAWDRQKTLDKLKRKYEGG